MSKDGWDLLQAGQYKSALRRLVQEYARDGDPVRLGTIGIAYLCMRDYATAKAKFDEAMSKMDAGVMNEWVGTSCWLLGNRVEAIALWREGIRSEYQDSSGGMQFPLLLYFASVFEPKLLPMADAANLISKAAKHRWAHKWPGPLGRYLLGEIDRQRLATEAEVNSDGVLPKRLAQIDFYEGLQALKAGHQFLWHMRRCASAKMCEGVVEVHLARGVPDVS